MLLLEVFSDLQSIFQTPGRHAVCIPVIVHVVFVFIGPGHTDYHIDIPAGIVMDTVGPEARHCSYNLKTISGQIAAVAGMADIIVDSVDYGGIAVYLLEGYLPFIVTLLTVHGNHGIECTIKPEFIGVFPGLIKMAVAVEEQIAGYLIILAVEVEGKTKSLGIPVGGTTVFLACKPFGTDIEAGIMTGIGLMELENIEPYALLGFLVTFYPHIIILPDILPFIAVLGQKFGKAGISGFRSPLAGLGCNLTGLIISICCHTYIFMQTDILVLGGLDLQFIADIFFSADFI